MTTNETTPAAEATTPVSTKKVVKKAPAATAGSTKKAAKKMPKVAKKAAKKQPAVKKATKGAGGSSENLVKVLKAVNTVGLKGRVAIITKTGLEEAQVLNLLYNARQAGQIKKVKHEDGSLEFTLTPAGRKLIG